MLIDFKELKTGDFFIFNLNEEINIYQKISYHKNYNCVLLNSGHLCNIYEKNTKVNKVELELKIHE